MLASNAGDCTASATDCSKAWATVPPPLPPLALPAVAAAVSVVTTLKLTWGKPTEEPKMGLICHGHKYICSEIRRGFVLNKCSLHPPRFQSKQPSLLISSPPLPHSTRLRTLPPMRKQRGGVARQRGVAFGTLPLGSFGGPKSRGREWSRKNPDWGQGEGKACQLPFSFLIFVSVLLSSLKFGKARTFPPALFPPTDPPRLFPCTHTHMNTELMQRRRHTRTLSSSQIHTH